MSAECLAPTNKHTAHHPTSGRTLTTSVPASWMRAARARARSSGSCTGGLAADSTGRMVAPAGRMDNSLDMMLPFNGCLPVCSAGCRPFLALSRERRPREGHSPAGRPTADLARCPSPPAWPPMTGTLTVSGSRPSTSAANVLARSTSRVVTPNRRPGLKAPARLSTCSGMAQELESHGLHHQP